MKIIKIPFDPNHVNIDSVSQFENGTSVEIMSSQRYKLDEFFYCIDIKNAYRKCKPHDNNPHFLRTGLLKLYQIHVSFLLKNVKEFSLKQEGNVFLYKDISDKFVIENITDLNPISVCRVLGYSD